MAGPFIFHWIRLLMYSAYNRIEQNNVIQNEKGTIQIINFGKLLERSNIVRTINFTTMRILPLRFIILILTQLTLLTQLAYSQSGILDNTFNGTGIAPMSTGEGYHSALQPDGKIILVGKSAANGSKITRLNPDGTLDLTFGTSGASTLPNGEFYRVKLQSDGKILCLGLDGNYDIRMVRYNANGTLDNTFASAGMFTYTTPDASDMVSPSDILIQSTGKIMVIFHDITYDPMFGTTGKVVMMRLTTAGIIDNTFGSGGFFNFNPNSITTAPNSLEGESIYTSGSSLLLANDKIVYAGSATSAGTTYENYLIRVNANGTLDTGFDNDGYVSYGQLSGNTTFPLEVTAIGLRSNGDYIIASRSAFSSTPLVLFSIQANGALNSSFGVNGYLSVGSYGGMNNHGRTGLIVLPNDKIFVAHSDNNTFKVTKLNPSGTNDVTFGTGGIASINVSPQMEFVTSLLMQPDDKLIVGGYFDNTTYTCIRLSNCSPINGVDVVNSCGPIAWIDGNIYSSSTNSPTYTYLGGAANGCDSTVTLNLTVTNILNQTVSTTTPSVCQNNGATIDVANSQSGIDYYLRDNANNAIIDGPVAGNGSPISFNTGAINATTTYNVYAGVNPFAYGGLDFDGVNDYVSIPNNNDLDFDGDDEFSIAAFVKHDGGLGAIFSKMIDTNPYTGYDVMALPSGAIVFQLINNWSLGQAIEVTTTSTPLLDGLYHHVAVTYSGSTTASGVRIYVDGVQQSTVTSVNNLIGTTVNTEDAAIGSRSNGGVHFDGEIDEVSIWDTQLSGSTVASLTTACLSGSESNLVALYRMNDQFGSTVSNISMGMPEGTLTNMDTVNAWVTGYLSCAGCTNQLTQTITINVLQPTTGTDVQTVCESFTWIDGITYTSNNNSATWTLMNAAGCDSIVTLDLTITQPSSGTDVQTACDQLTWIDGNTYTANNNSATWILTNAAGCDSTVTLDLTITNSTTGTDTQAACDEFTWIDGNTYSANNNSATWILTNAAGCDSTITLDLTINALPSTLVTDNGNATLTASGSGTYQWLDCDNNYAVIAGATTATFAPTTNGNYAVLVDNGNCTDTSACFVIDNVGFEEVGIKNVHLFPNPTSGLLTVTFEGSMATVVLMDASGKELQTSTMHSGNTLSLVEFTAGMYFVTVTIEDVTSVVRIQKH